MNKIFKSIPWMRHMPNQLTLTRVLVLPILLALYPFNLSFLNVICGLLFGAAALTDILDGYIARKTNTETKFGALLDPVADKMLTATALLLLAHNKAVPIFAAGLLLCRDIAVSGMRLIALEHGHSIKVSTLGKIKTVLQDVGIFCLMIGIDFFDIPLHTTGLVTIWLATLVSLYSGYLYFEEFRTLFPEENN